MAEGSKRNEGRTVGPEILNSAKRMARFPDATFRLTEEIRQDKGKAKVKRSRSDSPDTLPTFPALRTYDVFGTGPKRLKRDSTP